VNQKYNYPNFTFQTAPSDRITYLKPTLPLKVMLKNLGAFALLSILVIFLIYLVNPRFICMFTELIASTNNVTFLGDISIWLIIKTIGVVIGTFIGAKLFFLFLRKVFDKTPFPEKIENAILNLSKYVIWIIGFFILLGMVGVDLTGIVVSIGAFSIAISFATKDIIRNLISGIIVFTDKPFKIGDRIYVKKCEGIVKKIGIRSTTLKGDDGDLITVPNTVLVTNPVKKYKPRK
jgi:small-conductance mechanosensitive channel